MNQISNLIPINEVDISNIEMGMLGSFPRQTILMLLSELNKSLSPEREKLERIDKSANEIPSMVL